MMLVGSNRVGTWYVRSRSVSVGAGGSFVFSCFDFVTSVVQTHRGRYWKILEDLFKSKPSQHCKCTARYSARAESDTYIDPLIPAIIEYKTYVRR